jgi:hypothetical protein
MKRSPWARTISARSRRGRVIFSSVSENVGCRRGRRLCSASSRLGMACRCLGERCTHHTARTYVRIVRDFAEYFHQPPDKLGPEQIRQYQAHSVRSEEVCSCHGQSVCVRVATPEFLQHFFLRSWVTGTSFFRDPTYLKPSTTADPRTRGSVRRAIGFVQISITLIILQAPGPGGGRILTASIAIPVNESRGIAIEAVKIRTRSN